MRKDRVYSKGELLKKVTIKTPERTYIRRIFKTEHANDRFQDYSRFTLLASDPEFKKKIIEVTEKAMRVILTEYGDMEGEYGVHSESTGIGLIIGWRPDFYSNDGKNNAFIVSILPLKKSHYFFDVEAELVVESFLKKVVESARRTKRLITEKEGNVDHFTRDNFKVVFVDGKLYEHNIIDIIHV